jgi:hypothetical protein
MTVLAWFKQYHDRLISEMERDPPWSGYSKFECLWPIFLGGGLVFAFEILTGITIHNSFWIMPFLLPGVGWYLYLTKRYLFTFARHLRSPRP